MPKGTEKRDLDHPSIPNTNVAEPVKGINPSAPTAGTEGWGNTADERKVLSMPDAEGTRAGQMKGNPGDHMTEATHRASERATTNKSRDEDPRTEYADLSGRTSASPHSMNTSHGGTDRTFRCADVGNPNCQWETSAGSEDEIMQRVVEHARRDHGWTEWTDAMRSHVRDNIRSHKAA
jgi:predicted small metal-binding protein